MNNWMHFLDIAGAVFALISTVYSVKADILTWPAGIISSAMNIGLFAMTGIYGDMGCEFIYFVSMFYGWYLWKHPKTNDVELAISSLSQKLFWILLGITGSGIILLYLFLAHFTNSQVPLWDASTTVLSLTAQWMICRKIIECWFMWFFVDAMYIGLYFYKGIPAHGILFMVYLVLAVAGFLNWRRIMNKSFNSAIPAEEFN